MKSEGQWKAIRYRALEGKVAILHLQVCASKKTWLKSGSKAVSTELNINLHSVVTSLSHALSTGSLCGQQRTAENDVLSKSFLGDEH